MKLEEIIHGILDPKEAAKILANAAKTYQGDLGNLFPNPELLKPYYEHMDDEELKIFANGRYRVSESVAEFLVPRIRRAYTLRERIAIGEYFGYWRIWRMVVRVPGLSWNDISRIQQIANNPDVTPW